MLNINFISFINRQKLSLNYENILNFTDIKL